MKRTEVSEFIQKNGCSDPHDCGFCERLVDNVMMLLRDNGVGPGASLKTKYDAIVEVFDTLDVADRQWMIGKLWGEKIPGSLGMPEPRLNRRSLPEKAAAVIEAAREVLTAECSNKCFCDVLVKDALAALDEGGEGR